MYGVTDIRWGNRQKTDFAEIWNLIYIVGCMYLGNQF